MSKPDSVPSTSELIEKIAAPHPLKPRPSAPPEATAAWLDRVTRGVLLCAIVAMLYYVLPFTGTLTPFGLTVPVAEVPWALAFILAVWLLTAPEPGREAVYTRIRWLARLGPLAWAARMLAGESLARQSGAGQQGTPWVPGVYLFATSVLYASMAAWLFYQAILAARLGRRVLRFLFRIGSLSAVVGAPMYFVASVAVCVSGEWRRGIVGLLPWNGEVFEVEGYSWPFAGILLAQALLTCLPFWLLWHSLRRAARETRAMGDFESGVPAAPGSD